MQNPFHKFIKNVITVSHVMPHDASFSLTKEINTENAPCICPHISVILVRNSSFVFHNVRKTPTRTPITAIIASTGALKPPVRPNEAANRY